jgi:hypothetical protein
MKRLRASIALLGLVFVGMCLSAFAQQSSGSRRPARANTHETSSNSVREVYGKILSVDGSRITIETRTGQVVTVDATDAVRNHMSVPLVAGHAVEARGTSDAKNVIHAQIVLRAKASPDMWPADR